ncbi:MAG: Hpt domain-containing protein [Candidatus Solibacter sp.]|nr:Hpt domain-containing protein [Candidatus Solibacter sp.]
MKYLYLAITMGMPHANFTPSLSNIPALEKISAAAAREHADSVVSAASVLGEALRALAQSASVDPLTVSSVLQEGVANLQKALESPAREAPSQDVSIAQDPELMSDFIVESREHLVNIESQVLTLEREPFDSEALNSVFRGFHTIKGLAGFLELWEVQKLAHEVETVLDRARNSQWTINSAGIDVILASADYLRRWLVHMEAVLHHNASEAPARDEVLLSRIARLSSEPEAPESGGIAALAAAVSVPVPVAAPPPKEEPAANPLAPPAPAAGETGEKANEPVANPAAAASAPAASRRQETTAVKVDTAKLDYLVDMAGEMVIGESLVRHDPELAALKNPVLHRKIAHLTRITAELQKTAANSANRWRWRPRATRSSLIAPSSRSWATR